MTRLLAFAGLLFAFVATGCSSQDAVDDIRESNEQARRTVAAQPTSTPAMPTSTPLPSPTPRPTVTPTPETVTISVLEVDTGDCLSDPANQLEMGTEFSSVEVIGCDGAWDFIVLDTFDMSGGLYPNIADIDLAAERCDHMTTWFLYPTRGSWGAGDRAINCLMARTAFFVPEVGQCYGDGTDADELDEELALDCSSPHRIEIAGVLFHPGGEFPGEDALDDFAVDGCLTLFGAYVGVDYANSVLELYWVPPTESTWHLLGDRRIVCMVGSMDDSLLTGSQQGSGR